MGLIHILLKDSKNKIYQRMLSLREETELLICDNINAINNIGENSNISISSIDFDFSTLDLENKGWKEDDGLYDKLLIEFNNRKDVEGLLTRWK